MKITKQQNFSIDFFEFEHNNSKYRVGLGNYKRQGPGCEMFYPESGSEYMMVVYDNGWYKFELSEFDHDAGINYIAEKLKCSEGEAKDIHFFINTIITAENLIDVLSDGKARSEAYEDIEDVPIGASLGGFQYYKKTNKIPIKNNNMPSYDV